MLLSRNQWSGMCVFGGSWIISWEQKCVWWSLGVCSNSSWGQGHVLTHHRHDCWVCDFWENWICYSLVWFTLEWRYIKINTGLVIHCDSLNTHMKLSRIALSFSCFPYAHTNYIRVLFFLLFIIPYLPPMQLPVHVKHWLEKMMETEGCTHCDIPISIFMLSEQYFLSSYPNPT